MDAKAVKSAKHVLSLAHKARRELISAPNLQEQRTAWWHFLVAIVAVFEKLRAGAKISGGKTFGWWSSIANERKQDELLSYVHHARDSAYHGIEEVADAVTGIMHIGPVGITTGVDEERPFVDETNTSGMKYFLDGKELTPEQASHSGFFGVTPSSLKLATVEDKRFGNMFPPPTIHLGKPIDGRNIKLVSEAALAYFDDLIIKAEKRVL